MFDLEDALAVSQKVAARRPSSRRCPRSISAARLRTFRANNVRTRFFYRDLIEVVEAAGALLDGVVIPKVNGPEDVMFVDRLLSQIEEQVGLPRGHISIEALIESAEGVLHAEQIASATPRMGGLVFGMVDFAGDIGAQETGAEQFFYYNYAKAKTITAARAADITVVDGVTLAIRDLEACRRDATDGRTDGLRWQMGDPSRAGRRHQRGVHADGGGDREGATHPGRLCARRCGAGRGRDGDRR